MRKGRWEEDTMQNGAEDAEKRRGGMGKISIIVKGMERRRGSLNGKRFALVPHDNLTQIQQRMDSNKGIHA